MASASQFAPSQEFRLLCACAMWPASPSRDAALRDAAPHIRDWKTFAALATRHRVHGLVCDAMRNSALAVPEPIATDLIQSAQAMGRRNLMMAGEVIHVHQALTKAGIAAVTFKGVPLAQLAYGSIAIRHSKDIDILVRREDFSTAGAVLTGLGFKRTIPGEKVSEKVLRMWMRGRKDFAFHNGHCEIELHWQPVSNPHLLKIAWDPSSWIAVPLSATQRVDTLGPDDQFAYLCTHGAISGWLRLKWLADIGALLAQHSPDGIARLYRAACERGARRATGQALLLCARLLQSDVPGDLLATLRRDRIAVKLERVALHTLTLGGAAEPTTLAFSTVRAAFSRYALGNGLRYKMREAVLSLSDPIELIQVAYPESLLFLYPLARPLIWLYVQLFRKD